MRSYIRVRDDKTPAGEKEKEVADLEATDAEYLAVGLGEPRFGDCFPRLQCARDRARVGHACPDSAGRCYCLLRWRHVGRLHPAGFDPSRMGANQM